VTVTACPAMVSVVVRPEGLSFGATVAVTVPAPMSFAGETVTHEALDDADQAHPVALDTVIVAVPPDALIANAVDETE
jgi:hypothetical protein